MNFNSPDAERMVYKWKEIEMIPNPAIFTRILGKILAVETTWCDDGTSNELIESVATFFKNSKSENIGTVEELIESEKIEIARKELQETRANDKKKKGAKENPIAAVAVDARSSNQDKTAAPSDKRTKYNRPGKNQKSTGIFGDADALKGKVGKGNGKGRRAVKDNQSSITYLGEEDIDKTPKRKRKSRAKQVVNVAGITASNNNATLNASAANVSDVTAVATRPTAVATPTAIATPTAVTVSLPLPPINSDAIFNSDPIYDFVSRQMKSLHKLGMQKKKQKMQIQRENIVLDSRFQNQEQRKEAKSKQHRRHQTFLDSQAAIINQQQALLSMGMMQQQSMGMSMGMGMGMNMNMNMGMMQQQQQQQKQQQQQQQMAMGMGMGMGMGNGFNPNQMFMMQQQQMQMAMMGGTSSNMGGMASGFAGMSPQQMGGMNMNTGMGMSMAQSGMATPAIASSTNSKKVKQGNTNEDFNQNMSTSQQTPLYNPALFMGMTPQQVGANNTYVSDHSDNGNQDDVDWSDSDGEELSSDNEDDETPSEDDNK